MRMWRSLLVALAVVAGAMLASPLCAATVAALSDAALVRASDAIVQGRVVHVEVRTYDVGPQVFTEATVAVADALVGVPSPQQTIVVRIPGGETDAHHVIVPGMPQLAVGDDVVLFLEALPDAFGDEAEPGYLPVGLGQGVWRREGVDGWVRDPQDGLLLAPGEAAPPRHPVSLDTIVAWCAAHPLAVAGVP